MTVHDFTHTHSVLQQFVYEMRHAELQTDRLRFRKNIERIGEILAYEASKLLPYQETKVTTPLGTAQMMVPTTSMVVCSILRAGLPLHQGVLNIFDTAESGYISAFRKHTSNSVDFEIVANYWAAPSVENKAVLLCDPMLATGKTLENVLKILSSHGTPEQIHILSIIGSQEGVVYIKKRVPPNAHLWIAAIDDSLNDKGYIIPGLGDAGDLAFGEKLA
jgi:uracil phosphoribosyltransferase